MTATFDRFDLSLVTSPEIGELLNRARLALLPVGATEQHGPNLGQAADWRIAYALARRAAVALEPHAVVTPPMPFGLSAHHMDFPGTITVSFETFKAACVDVVQSLMTHSIDTFVFVNGHAGNQAALSVITSHLHFDLGVRAASSFWMTQSRDVIERHRRTDRWGHACEIETSLALALAPDLVRHDALAPGDLIEDYPAYADNDQAHALQVPQSFADRTRNGAFGDATQASAEAGEEIAAATVDRLAAFARDTLNRSAGQKHTSPDNFPGR